MSKVYYVELVEGDFLEPYKIEIGVFTSLEKAIDAARAYISSEYFSIIDLTDDRTCIKRIDVSDNSTVYIHEFELNKYQPEDYL